MLILKLAVLATAMWVLGYVMGKAEIISRFDIYYGKLDGDDIVLVKHLRQILKGEFDD